MIPPFFTAQLHSDHSVIFLSLASPPCKRNKRLIAHDAISRQEIVVDNQGAIPIMQVIIIIIIIINHQQPLLAHPP
jgi:hypothetical protein